jgi:hypothetical protein
MSVTLQQLQDEHQREVIGRELARLLARVATATAKTYPPDYSPAGVWDDAAIEDALQDWTEDRLLRRNDLSKMLAGARSVGALRAALTTSFGQHLTNRRRRSAATNLYKRMLKMLRDDEPFKPVQATRNPADQPWTVSGLSATDLSPLSESDLVRLAFELSDDDLAVVRYGPHSLKESPILRKPALHRFLLHMLTSAEGALTPALLIEVMKRRFNLVDPELVELHEAEEVDEPPTAAAGEVEATAASVIARLGQRRCDVLMAFTRHGAVESAAQAHGVDPAVVERTLSETLALIAEHAADRDEAAAIYDRVIEKLFGGSE